MSVFFWQEFVPWLFGVSLWFFIIFVYSRPFHIPSCFEAPKLLWSRSVPTFSSAWLWFLGDAKWYINGILTNHQDGSMNHESLWILLNPRFHGGVFYMFSMVHPLVIAPFRPRSIPYIWPGRRDGQGEMQKEPSLLWCTILGIQQFCFFMFWNCCLQCFLWHKLKSCTTVGSLPGEPNCHMLDEEWRGQQVSCKVFSTIYRDVSTFGNYQASIIIHSCFCNANHRASHFADLTGTCMQQLSEMEMCGACRKLKDFRMRYQDHENHFDSWTMG